MRLELDIYGDPKGQPRPRAFTRKMGARFVAGVYDSDVADEWKAAVDAAIDAKKWLPQIGAATATLHFWFKRPKSHFNSKGILRQSAPVLHIQKPDADNLAKLVLDRLTKAGVWSDDSVVIMLTVTKGWAGDRAPGCRAIIDTT